MKRVAFIVLVLVLWLATWKGAGSKAHTPDVISTHTDFPTTETMFAPTPRENLVPETGPTATFEMQTYME